MNNHVDVDKLVNAPIIFHLQHEEFGFPEGLHQVGDSCVPAVSFSSLFTSYVENEDNISCKIIMAHEVYENENALKRRRAGSVVHCFVNTQAELI